MEIIQHYRVPTGDIIVVQGEEGLLELVSLKDYGKNVNVKADFLGLHRTLDKVEHQEMLPLSEKWVVTVSTQYGCMEKCKTCDAPNAGNGKNVSTKDLVAQVMAGVKLHPEVRSTKRLNIHWARLGEPTWNRNVLEAFLHLDILLYHYFDSVRVHQVVSTMLPKYNKDLEQYLAVWAAYKYGYQTIGSFNKCTSDLGLQFSINSTSDKERQYIFSDRSITLAEAGKIGNSIMEPKGRKYTLNFAVAGWEIDGEVLKQHFDPKRFICKLTPMHKTNEAIKHDIKTEGDYTTVEPYLEAEQSLKDAGFDVLIFVASEEEDLGRITCGNAIIGGSKIESEYTRVK